MTIRVIDFADGFTSSTAPISSTFGATGFDNYASDAAFESANGAPSDGDAYYNTTDNKVRIHENGSWVENASFEA